MLYFYTVFHILCIYSKSFFCLSLFHSTFKRMALLILLPTCKYIHFNERNGKSNGRYWNKSYFSSVKQIFKEVILQLCVGVRSTQSLNFCIISLPFFFKSLTNKFSCLKEESKEIYRKLIKLSGLFFGCQARIIAQVNVWFFFMFTCKEHHLKGDTE